MSPSPDQLTAAEISRLAGVTRATVSNWRRRHEDFPRPIGGTDGSPTYDRAEVETWLTARGQLPARSVKDLLADEVRRQPTPDALHRLFPAVIALDRTTPATVKELDKLSNSALAKRIGAETAPFVKLIPTLDKAPAFNANDAALLRTLVACVDEAGAAATIEVISERLAPDIAVRGTHHTPPKIAQIMVDLVGKAPSSRVLDPACGTGGLLAAAAASLHATKLCGQDIAAEQAAPAAARLSLLAPPVTVDIRMGDTLRDDAFPWMPADVVLCNPPYASRSWGHDERAYDSRWAFGVPPKNESELAWLQHCLAHLRPGGTAVVLIPPGVAWRPAGRRIRAELTRAGAVRAVMALTPGVAPPFNIGLHLWVLRRPEPDRPSSADPVLFVDASDANDWDAVRDRVLGPWRSFTAAPDRFKPIQGTARAVPVLDLMRAEMDLSPARHVRAVTAVAAPEDFAASAKTRRTELHDATAALHAMDDADWPPAGDETLTWRTVTIGDLIRGKALEMRRSASVPRTSEDDTSGQERPVMTARDVTTGGPPSTSQPGHDLEPSLALREGDILLSEVVRNEVRARVVSPDDAGSLLGPHVLLFRPDTTRLDSWFLAGFLAADENVHSAASGTSIVRIHPGRLRVPLMPLDRQREYGSAFERLHALRRTAELAHRLAEETARELNLGLTAGVLLPPATDPSDSRAERSAKRKH